MAIPRYDDMFADLLSLMEDGAPREKSSLILPLAKRLNVSEEDQTETYETRDVSIFVDRISWALTIFPWPDCCSGLGAASTPSPKKANLW